MYSFNALKNKGFDLEALPHDMSNRRYVRATKGAHSYIIMDAPYPENPKRFCDVAVLLKQCGVSAPQIFESCFVKGHLLLEDFGQNTFTNLLNRGGDSESSLYNLATDVLIYLAKSITKKPVLLEDYTLNIHLNEAELFLEWYFPFIFKKHPSIELKDKFIEFLKHPLAKALEALPAGIILRDYHVDNLMILNDKEGIQSCGLLDFQDAMWGPITYDFVSLTEDARRDVPKELEETLWQKFYDALSWDISLQDVKKHTAVISFARHLKILGVFTRYAMISGNKKYLDHVPRVIRLAKKCLKIMDKEKEFYEIFNAKDPLSVW